MKPSLGRAFLSAFFCTLVLLAVVGFVFLMFKHDESPQQVWERMQGWTRAKPVEKTNAPVAVAASEPTHRSAGFVHPGITQTRADLELMALRVKAGDEPWKSSWARLEKSPHGLGWRAAPQEAIVRGNPAHFRNNYTRTQRDAAAIYQCALRYHVTGDERFADHAVGILNAWSRKLKRIEGDSNGSLAAGIVGYEFAAAAELLRDYRGWQREDFARFLQMMKKVFYVDCHRFMTRHHGQCATHYRSNWETCNIAAIMAIGILCDDQQMFDEAVAYFREGSGNGCVYRTVWYIHPNGLGQTEESGRDQGHNLGSLDYAVKICEAAWHQGVDLYGEDNNRLLRGLEYTAKYNLGHDVPSVPHRNCSLRYTENAVSAHGRGANHQLYEMAYNHYVNRRGLAAPYVAESAARLRPSGGPDEYGGHPSSYDWFGYTSLTHSLDPIAKGAPPSGLRAVWTKGAITLTWWGSAGATGYIIKRNGAVIGTTGAKVTTFTDTNVVTGATYRYVVGDSASLTVSQSLVAQYEKPGQTLPPNSAAFADFTITARVYWEGGAAWQRIFDFGSDTAKTMFLSPNPFRFSITTTGNGEPQTLDASMPFPTNQWVTVAVTLAADTGAVYVNGQPVATGRITLDPLFAQMHCYIGKSQWPVDPPFAGKIEDLRIYNYALSAAEIAAQSK